MAVTNITAQGYMGSSTITGQNVGKGQNTMYDNVVYVVRYSFKTDAYGATRLTFRTKNAKDAYVDLTGGDRIAEMYFKINQTETDTSVIGHMSNSGTKISAYQYGSYVQGTIAQNLLPNTTYYLWLYPGTAFSAGGRFAVGGVTITTSGSYGQPSTVSASDAEFGETVDITVTPKIVGVTHTVTTSCGGIVETIAENSTETAFTWTPTVENYAPYITDSLTATATITVRTFYGSADWGTSTATILLTFDEDAVKPTLGTWVGLAYDNSGTAASAIACFVQNHSKCKATFTPNGVTYKYGASKGSFSISINGVEYTDENNIAYSDVLATSGTLTVICKVTDSRGVSASETKTITVEPYSTPVLTGYELYRANSSGVIADDGAYLHVLSDVIFSSLGNRNSVSLYVNTRRLSGQYSGDGQPLTVNVAANLSGLDPNYTYEARLLVRDSLGNEDVYTKVIPGQSWALKFTVDSGTIAAAGIGKAPEDLNRLEIPSTWQVRRSSAHAIFTDDTEWTGEQTAISALQGKTEHLPTGLKIQYGLAATTVSGSTATAHVTFDTEFETTPNVVCSVQGNSTNMFEARPYNVAVDGFDIISLRNASGTIGPVAVNVHWIAIGV